MSAEVETILVVPVFSPLANLAFLLRREVFVLEQNVPAAEEFDARDLGATHLVTLREGDVVATLRILWHGDSAQISRFVVRKALRSLGLGKRLLHEAMLLIEQRGVRKVFLDAQLDKVPFYERFAFQADGDTFLDGGIVHTRMTHYGGTSPSNPMRS